VPAIQGSGVTVPASPFIFIARSEGRNTLLVRVWRQSGSFDHSQLIGGSFGVAGAAYDGSTTGLSADGRTLVLASITNRLLPRATQLLVIDAHSLRISARIGLRGFFTVDAISPGGRWLYLLHYRSAANLLDYEVRAYDLAAHRLLTKPVVDPREPDEKMLGLPMARTMSPDGRWAYTLYERPDKAPFVHALDTGTRSAYCVDVPASLAGTSISSATLVLRPPTTLRIDQNGSPVALMDTRTFAVRQPGAVGPTLPPPRRAHAAPRDSGAWWVFSVAALGVLVGVSAIVLRRRWLNPVPQPRVDL
jgi:hypothetical protein